LKNIGVIKKAKAEDWGLSGVQLRSAGRPWDLRIQNPYELYYSMNMDIPVSRLGDCFDRYLLRVEELKQSTVLAQESIVNMVEGPVKIFNTNFFPPSRDDLKTSMEALINHFKFYVEGFRLPPGYAYVSAEAPKGEFGVFLVSDGGFKPFRCKIRAPGFFHLQSLDFFSHNLLLADVVTLIGTLDIVFGEVDR